MIGDYFKFLSFKSLGILLGILILVSCASHRPRPGHLSNAASEASTKIIFISAPDSTNLAPNFWKHLRSLNADLAIFAGKIASSSDLDDNRHFKKLLDVTPAFAIWNSSFSHDQESLEKSKERFLDLWNEPKNSSRRSRPGVYDSFNVGPPGSSLQVILLDSRSFRSSKELLGSDQWIWLKTQMKTPSDVRLIVCSEGILENHRSVWNEFSRERSKLLKLVEESSGQSVFLTSNETATKLIKQKRSGKKRLVEFVSGPSNRADFGFILIDWAKNGIHLEARQSKDGSTTAIYELTTNPSRKKPSLQ